ncbi:MAG: lysophospholipid acyltransferase family protein [Tannerellaceae bacterium]|jgi:KDO2-lipid IV(A) lauroyltransferase|nr:lysophospholipid acyltransferase family protein [Tannerellaceae bacterium]
MSKKIGYALLYIWVKLHAILPLRLLYVLSDVLYLLMYRLAGYRLKVTRRNMKAAFPEKTPKELRQMERDFYHHFADYFVETIKLAHISEEEIQRRACMTNPQLIDRLVEQGHTCILVLLGHYGNWEWFTAGNGFFQQARMYPIYRPLNNKVFDRLFVYLRSRFGSIGIRRRDTLRDLVRLKREKTPALVVLLADQTPGRADLHYWTTFLGQNSAVLTGPERIARKLNIPIVYADVQKRKRGYYTVEFNLLTATPQETPIHHHTEQYIRLMEQTILRNPAYWLWTHKRWKYKPEDAL